MQQVGNGAQRNLRGLMHRISKSPGRDRREAHAFTVFKIGLLHGMAVSAFQNLRLILVAAIPDRTNGMDYESRREIAARGGNGLACRQRAALFTDLLTLFQKTRAGSAMNGSVHASATQQGRVGGVHNGAGSFIRDVAYHQFKSGYMADPVSQAWRHFVCLYLSVSASTPGSFLPSRNSSDAPPPVEI